MFVCFDSIHLSRFSPIQIPYPSVWPLSQLPTQQGKYVVPHLKVHILLFKGGTKLKHKLPKWANMPQFSWNTTLCTTINGTVFLKAITCSHHSHTHTHNHSHARTHTHNHSHARTHAQTHIHSHRLTQTHIHTHNHLHAHIHAYAHTHTHTQTCTNTHTHTHTLTHSHIHTYTHTHTHTVQSKDPPPFCPGPASRPPPPRRPSGWGRRTPPAPRCTRSQSPPCRIRSSQSDAAHTPVQTSEMKKKDNSEIGTKYVQ